MSDKENMVEARTTPSGSTAPAWWLVFTRELTDLWIGGKALYLVIAYSILLGIISYVVASSSELSLIPPKEMVFEMLKVSIAAGGIICLIIGADTISGERERATIESLLLTPISRRQIVAGKFLAAVSAWPACLAVTIPFWAVLAQGDEAFRQCVLWGAILGGLVAPALTGVGMLVSLWCNTNKTSFFVSLGIYLLLLAPAQLPGRAQTGTMGALLQAVNPIAATTHFLARLIVNNRSLDESWSWLASPALFCTLSLGLLFLFAKTGLRLEADIAGIMRPKWGRALGLFAFACLMSPLSPSPAMAAQIEKSSRPELPLQVAIDLDYKVVRAGEKVEFNTVVTNSGTGESAPVILAMNIINLSATGEVVDPEDWSPQRTQHVPSLAPGKSATHSWRINAILDGDFMVYLVAIPSPDSRETTSQPVASSGIHLSVTPFTRLNPGGVVPYAVGVPLALVLGMALVFRRRRRSIDTGGV